MGILSERKSTLAQMTGSRYNIGKEVLFMPTEKDYKVIEKATLYDLRLIFSTGEKDTYTREEIVELLDKIALTKDQE